MFHSSLIYTKTFIQILFTLLPEGTIINCLAKDVLNDLNIDDVILDLKELRKIFKENMNEQIIIPRDQWNNIRLKLVRTIIHN